MTDVVPAQAEPASSDHIVFIDESGDRSLTGCRWRLVCAY